MGGWGVRVCARARFACLRMHLGPCVYAYSVSDVRSLCACLSVFLCINIHYPCVSLCVCMSSCYVYSVFSCVTQEQRATYLLHDISGK